MSQKAEKAINYDGILPEVYKRRWKVLSAMCLALLVAVLANSSMNLALPTMSVEMGLSTTEMTWIVEVYMLVFAALLFVAAAVGDRYGRKLVMQIGLAVFVASAAYAGFVASNGTELIFARAVMGLGGAMVMPTTLSIINTTFPRKERPKAIAIWGAIAGIGISIGNIVSGILIEHFTWHSVFIFSMVLAILSLACNFRLLHESKDEQQNPVDWLGGLLSVVGLVGLVYAIMEAPSGDNFVEVLIASIVSVISLTLFVLWQRKAKSPMLDVSLFKNRSFTVSTVTLLVVFFAQMAIFFSLSQLMQLILGYSPMESALLTIPFMVPMMIVAPRVPLVVSKIGAKKTVVTGLLLIALSFLIVSVLWPSQPGYFVVFGTISLLMVGSALATTPGTNILMDSVPRNRSGMGSAMNDTTRELGGALGIAILGSMISSGYSSHIKNTVDAVGGVAGEAIGTSAAIALGVAEKMGESGLALAENVKSAWMNGFSEASLVAGIVLLVAALVAGLLLPEHSSIDD